MQTISLELPENLVARLEEESVARHTNTSAIVQAALERELAESADDVKLSCFELAQDLAGSIRGLAPDIATNPKYMEGFGK